MSTTPARPYKGLVPYREEDWPFFFGREAEQEIIINNLLASRLTLLYGPSGVGKSSVLRAGVAHKLRERAKRNRREVGSPEFAAVVFRSWTEDPIAKLSQLIAQAVSEVSAEGFDPPSPRTSLTETLRSWSKILDGDLLIILDQFEEYFMYHGEEKGPGTFNTEFARAVKSPDLQVRFLISIREDALPKLDRFKKDIPNPFSNYLRIKHLNRQAASEAILMPIDRYNEMYPADGQPFTVEPRLVDAVLGQIEIESDVEPGANERQKSLLNTEPRFETAYLQLVMDRIWEEEVKANSRTLRANTLARLGGPRRIVRLHLGRALRRLSRSEKALAANAFRFLVGPSGHKQSYTARELASRTERNEQRISRLLEKLTGDGYRILHSSNSSAAAFKIPRYEISHDMLGRPIEEWRRRYAENVRHLKRLSLAAVAITLIFSVAGVVLFIKLKDQEKRRAVTAGSVNSQVLAQLYQRILGGDDPAKTRDNLQGTLNTLDEALDRYQQDGNRIGEGITYNNIAGIYRFLGEANRNYGDHGQAEAYYQQARDKYQQALDLLKDSLGQGNPEVAHSLNDLAHISILEGKYAEAEPLFEQSRDILKRALQPDDRYLADGLRNLAECYYREGKYLEAAPLYERALEIRKARLEEDDPELIQVYYDLAWLYFDEGKYALADPLFDTALEIQKATADPAVPAKKLNNLACLLFGQRKYARAGQRFSEALDMWKRTNGPQDMGKAISLNGLAAVYGKQGKDSEKQYYLNLAQTVDQAAVKQNSYFAAYDLNRLAALYDDLGKAEAELVYKQVIRIWERCLGEQHQDTAVAMSDLASFYYKNGNTAEAGRLYNQAHSVQMALPYSPRLARTLYGLARLYSDQGRYNEAEPLFRQAITIQERTIPEHLDFADTLNAYADLLSQTDRQAAGDQLRSRAEQIRQINTSVER